MANFLFSGVCLQLILLLVIAVLVVCSRSQAALTTQDLLHLQEFESMRLLKLHRLERHGLHVHELVRNRMFQKNKDTVDLEDFLESGQYDPDEVIDPENDPLMDQYQQLTKMSLDLLKHADVTALQSSIQKTAIDEIISNYGEGPVKVVVELDFGGKSFIAHNNQKHRKRQGQARHTHDMIKGTYISIIMWPDTPHAAWSWLEQMRRSVWDGSSIGFNPTSTLLQFKPTKDDPMDRGHLEFVEGHPRQEKSNPDMHHGAWTIGLRETIGDDQKKGTMEMFINLTDNQESRKHETCVGKIFDGFDALQRLLEGTTVAPDGEADTNVTVKSVSAMHLTHQELQQIYR
jgi:cyclophilin family peptidyl-prolyl cis-trans isomerase